MSVQAPSAAEHAANMETYLREGKQRAREAGNRGPLRLDGNGKLHPDILDAFRDQGFYVLEGIIDSGEIDELRADIDVLLDRAPTGKDATVDVKGRAAFGREFARSPYSFIKPLSDPWGGTELLSGRHQVQMTQPEPDQDAPAEVIHHHERHVPDHGIGPAPVRSSIAAYHRRSD